MTTRRRRKRRKSKQRKKTRRRNRGGEGGGEGRKKTSDSDAPMVLTYQQQLASSRCRSPVQCTPNCVPKSASRFRCRVFNFCSLLLHQHGAPRCAERTRSMSTVPPPPMASAAARARGSSIPLSSESFSRTLTKPRAPTSLLARRGTKDVTLTGAVPLTLTAEAILANSAGRPHARSVSITPAPVKVSGRGQRPWQRPWASVVVGAPAPDDDAAAYQRRVKRGWQRSSARVPPRGATGGPGRLTPRERARPTGRPAVVPWVLELAAS